VGAASWVFYFRMPLMFLGWAAGIFAWRAVVRFRRFQDPLRLVSAMQATSLTNTVFGLGVTAGLVVAHLLAG
jgi:1,4-dihydroxy-2-naphthoate octaprenyltransferase